MQIIVGYYKIASYLRLNNALDHEIKPFTMFSDADMGN